MPYVPAVLKKDIGNEILKLKHLFLLDACPAQDCIAYDLLSFLKSHSSLNCQIEVFFVF